MGSNPPKALANPYCGFGDKLNSWIGAAAVLLTAIPEEWAASGASEAPACR